MSNSLLTDSIIAKEALMQLKNQLGFSASVNRQYDDKFAQEGTKIGSTINIRKPSRYAVTTGAALNIQDSEQETVALTLDTQKHVGMGFSSKDLTLSLNDFSNLHIKPAVTALANAMDYDGYSLMYKSVFSSVGVPSATAFPSDLEGFLLAKAKIADNGGPVDPLTACVAPRVESSLVNGLSGYFNSQKEVSKQYEKGIMGFAAGSTFRMTQNVASHTAGSPAGAPAIKTTITAQGAEAVALDGITGSITNCYKKGDVIQIGGVYAVNPLTKQSTGELKQFVVTADTNSITNEIASLPISPAIYSTGAKQNVNALPVDGAAVTLFGHATNYAGLIVPQNLVFHKDAFALGCADLVLPKGVHMAARASDKESGLSVRLVSQYDIVNDRMNSRLDILYGWKCLYPEFACRVVGQPA